MEITLIVNGILTVLFFVCYMYQFIYIPVSWFGRRRKCCRKPVMHRYAVLICARNEEYVIGDLIDSIHEQTYPQELIDIYAAADNCTDDTKDIAQKHGAIVYERHNSQLTGKGYALEYLMKRIRQDVPEGYDGYFVFDADNLLKKNFIEEMNRYLSEGYDVITGCRLSKNFGYNWISAGSGLWFLRESRYLNNARSVLNTSAAVSGTGFMFSRRIAERMKEWPYHLLTEDIEFTIDLILKGETIVYCPEAEFYDEQPVTLSQSHAQRFRWSAGYLEVCRKYGRSLFQGILRGNFACYDMLMSILPAYVISVVSLVLNGAMILYEVIVLHSAAYVLQSFLHFFMHMYLTFFLIGLITMISESRKINTSVLKKTIYTFTFPVFMFTYIPIAFEALFRKGEWTPVRHTFSRAETEGF